MKSSRFSQDQGAKANQQALPLEIITFPDNSAPLNSKYIGCINIPLQTIELTSNPPNVKLPIAPPSPAEYNNPSITIQHTQNRIQEIDMVLKEKRLVYLWWVLFCMLIDIGLILYIASLLVSLSVEFHNLDVSTTTNISDDQRSFLYQFISSIAVLVVTFLFLIELMFGVLAYILKMPMLAKIYRRLNMGIVAFSCFVIVGVGYFVTANPGPFISDFVVVILSAMILFQGPRFYKILKERNGLEKLISTRV